MGLRLMASKPDISPKLLPPRGANNPPPGARRAGGPGRRWSEEPLGGPAHSRRPVSSPLVLPRNALIGSNAPGILGAEITRERKRDE